MNTDISLDLLTTLDDMVVMFIDVPLSVGISLTEEEEAMRRRALDVIARAKGESCHV